MFCFFALNALPLFNRVSISLYKTAYTLESTLFFIILLYNALVFQTTCHLSFSSNILQFTTDQNLLIKKDIFGAAHFRMTCQPFLSQLPSAITALRLRPYPQQAVWAESQREGAGAEGWWWGWWEGERQIVRDKFVRCVWRSRPQLRYENGPDSAMEEVTSSALSRICCQIVLVHYLVAQHIYHKHG